MKKLIALFLAFALCFGMFAACGQKEPAPSTVAPTVPATEATEPQQTEDPGDPEGLAAALEYVKTIYKNAGGLTPKDFVRIGTVPVGTTMFEIVWTASVGEDMVKIVRGADGMVTIDVNEEASEETPYTLTATITDAAGNSVSHSWEHTIPAHLGVADILDAAYALESGASLPYEATLTGVITSIDTLWSDEFKNITVTIVMEGHEDRPIQCYRLAGDGAKDLAVGDTITVTGTLTNYKGLIEFAQGCTLDNVISGGGTPPGPKVYKYTQPLKNGQKVVIFCNSYKMALSAKKAGYYNKGVKISKDADGNYTGFTKNEVWTVIKHSNGTYSFADADGKTLGLDAEFSSMNLGAKYDDWGIVKVGSGKYIIQNTKRDGYFIEWYAQYNNFSTYNPNAPEKDKQFIMSFYIIDDENMPEEEPTPEVETALGIVTEPKAETAYKLGMNQAALEQLLLVTGEMSGYYGATSEEAAEAVDVYVEAVEGGYHLYMMKDEAKKYINLVPSGSYTNVKYEDAAATVYTFDAEHNTFVAVVGEGSFFMGTRDSYNTVGAYAASNLGSDNYYPIHLYEEVPLVPVVQENPVAGTAYMLGMDQAALEQLLLVTGEMSGYYGATTEDMAEAVDVFVEETEGGYYLYMIKGEAKKYINLVPSGTYTNVKYEDTAATVYTFNAEHKTFVAVVGEGSFFMGTRDSYNTVGAYAASNLGSTNYYPIHLYALGAPTETPEEPDVPDVPVEPEVPEIPEFVAAPEIGKAYYFAVNQAKAEKFVYFTGVKSGNFLATSENAEEGVVVYLEEAEGGFRIYFMDGETKKYVEMNEYAAGKVGVEIVTEPTTVNRWDAERKAVVTTVGETDYYMGTYNTFTTISSSKFSYIEDTSVVGVSQFPAAFVEAEVEAPEVPEEPAVPEFLDKVEMGKPYYFAINQAKAEKFIYFTGEKSGNYLATSDKAEDAAVVYLEEAEGGFRIYFMDGETKKYVEMNEYAAGKVGVEIVTEPTTVNRFDAERKAVVTTAAGADYYMGTYNTFTTISASKFSYIEDTSVVGVSQFPAAFVEAEVEEPEVPEVPEEPEVPEIPEFVAAPEIGKAYYFAVNQAKAEKFIYFTGEKSGNYLATSENAEDAVAVYLEEVEGGFRIYFMDGETKKYVEMNEYAAGKVGVEIVTEPTTINRWDAERKAVVTTVGETDYYMGTYNTFTTISSSKFSYIADASVVGVSQFPAAFVEAAK